MWTKRQRSADLTDQKPDRSTDSADSKGKEWRVTDFVKLSDSAINGISADMIERYEDGIKLVAFLRVVGFFLEALLEPYTKGWRVEDVQEWVKLAISIGHRASDCVSEQWRSMAPFAVIQTASEGMNLALVERGGGKGLYKEQMKLIETASRERLAKLVRRGRQPKYDLSQLNEYATKIDNLWSLLDEDNIALHELLMMYPTSGLRQIIARRLRKEWELPEQEVMRIDQKTIGTEPYACALEHAAQLCGVPPFYFTTRHLSEVRSKLKQETDRMTGQSDPPHVSERNTRK